MRLSGNEITIVRGEAFAIDRTIVNRDGSPYILSNRLVNPHILITVADNVFFSKANKVYKYYLPLDGAIKFNYTNAININDTSMSGEVYKEFPEVTLGGSGEYYHWSYQLSTVMQPVDEFNKFDRAEYYRCVLDAVDLGVSDGGYSWSGDVNGKHVVVKCDDLGDGQNVYIEWDSELTSGSATFYHVDTDPLTFLSIEKDGQLIGLEPGDALFYLETSPSEKIYKYWKPDYLAYGVGGTWQDYSLRFIKTFASTVTAEWEPKTYYHSIELITGPDPKNGGIDNSVILLPPTKLNVLSNLKGGL